MSGIALSGAAVILMVVGVALIYVAVFRAIAPSTPAEQRWTQRPETLAAVAIVVMLLGAWLIS